MLTTKLLCAATVAPGFIALCGCAALTDTPPRGAVTVTVPAKPDRAARYAIYVHDVALDRTPEDAERRARFDRVVQALARQGLHIIAEIRPAGTIQKVPEDLDRYAQKVGAQVRQLMAAGVPARQLNVIGYSRGAVLALMSSSHVGDSGVGYVALAACMNDSGSFKAFAPVLMRYAEGFTGRFLSITEQSDADFGSCAPYFAKSAARPVLAERVLQTGKGHLFAMEPDDAWLRPTVAWVQGRE